MIPKETIDKIFNTSRIEEVVGDFVQLKKRGVNMIGNCPFHDEKTPSFTVSVAKGIYKCFGCGEGGNSVNFIMNHENCTYPEALRHLAKKYNIEVEDRDQTPEEVLKQTEREGLFIVTNFANTNFQENLHKTIEGKSIGLSYFKERKLNDEMIEKFELGYCMDSFDAFTKTALKAGYNLDNMVKTGLTISKEERSFDRFKGRVMFPIHNLTGKVLGFGGRTLKNDKKAAKYVNSPESDIYSKSKVLYGMYFAKKSIINNDLCYLVEGYTDVISLHQVGIENVVASSGTSLTVEQIGLIKRFSNNITMLFDGDTAGIKASFRGIDMILEQGLNVKVVTFPEGEDPDSQAKKLGNEGMKDFISSNSKDFVLFKSKLLLEGNENDPVAKAGVIKDIASTISIIPDRIIREEYIKMCWNVLDVEQETLFTEVAKIRRNKFMSSRQSNERDHYEEVVDLRPKRAPQAKESSFSSEYQEKDLMRILVNYGDKHIHFFDLNEDGEEEETVYRIADYIINDLQEDGIIFKPKGYQMIIQEYEKALAEGKDLPTEQFFIQHKNKDVASTIVDLLSSAYALSKNWEERHQIVVSTEEIALKKAVVNSINSLKMKQVEALILANQEKMKEPSSSENIEDLLKTQILLSEAQKQISAELTRVIIK
ncbi:MAG: DNA primase [Flavobacteriales bacterium]|nr:DNA primase [Flavobacteriales bacterium]